MIANDDTSNALHGLDHGSWFLRPMLRIPFFVNIYWYKYEPHISKMTL
jgi:hypothetical protein